MANFPIIHISDLHISVKPRQKHAWDYLQICAAEGLIPRNLLSDKRIGFSQGSHCPDVARAAAKFLSRNLSDHEMILITGDLGSTGQSADLKQAARYLMATPSGSVQYLTNQYQPTLGFRNKKALLPGNHDRFRDHYCNANGIEFDQEFEKQWGTPPNRVRTASIRHKATGEVLHFVMGDFCLRANNEAYPYLANTPLAVFRCGQGTVHDDTLKAMVAKTAELKQENPLNGVVWVSHFPPTGALCGFIPSLTLQGWPMLIDAAESAGVEYIISGHIHEAACFKEKTVNIICAGALCTFFERGGNWIHSIKFELNTGKVALSDYKSFRYDLSRGAFIPISTT